MDNNRQVWDYYGKNNPYYGVATVDKFRSENLNEDLKDEFFASGNAHIKRVWDVVETEFVPDFRPQRAIDFGCGVGRLVVPLAARCREITGVDVSQGMLDEAAKNCVSRGIENAKFVLSDANLSRLEGKFDFVHSFIVFQHINPELGEKLFRRMVELLEEGGIGAVQFSYAHQVGASEKFRLWLYRNLPISYKLRNRLKGLPPEEHIPMYEYDLNRLFLILQENDCHKLSVRFSYHGFEGVVLFFQKRKLETF